MIKKISTILLLLAVISCQHKKAIKDGVSVVESGNPDNQIIEESYQTVENEEQAKLLNAEAEKQIIEVPDRIFFDYDSSAINENSQKILNTQIEWLQNSPEINVIIEGHCDEKGTREYNIALGEKRANSVKSYFIESKISPSRIKIVSYGKEKPALFGNSDDVYSKNRRAVIVPSN